MPKILRCFALVPLIILSILVFGTSSGCNGSSSKSTLEFQVATRSVNDVLTFFVIPRDANGNLLDLSGTLTVKLWDKTDSNPPTTGDLVGHWDNLKINSADFQDGRGTIVSLVPNDEFMGKSGQQSFIELDFQAGRQSCSASGIVILGDLPVCCGKS